jgi:hypothetical protein
MKKKAILFAIILVSCTFIQCMYSSERASGENQGNPNGHHRMGGAPTVTTNATTDVGNTNATLNMDLLDDEGKPCTLWFNCTEYHEPVPTGTGDAITLKWEKALNCSMDAGCVAKDIDGDGIMEIFVAGAKRDFNNTRMDVMCFEGDTGAVLWEKDLGFMDHCSNHIPVFIADLNDDGNFEMVLSAHNHTFALNCRDGSWFWNASVWSGSHQGLVFDALGDGFPFVYVNGYVRNYTSPTKTYKLYGRNGTLAATSTWNAGVSDGGISCADVNNDGRVELFISGGGSGSYPERCFDANLTSIWTYNTQSSSMAPALVDYNHDGYLEVVTTTSGSYNSGVLVLNGTTGAVIYKNASVPGLCGHHNPSIADFNGDGHYELATAYGNEPLWTKHAKVFDLSTRLVDWTSPNNHSGEPPTFVNILGDNTLEMMDWTFQNDTNISIYNASYTWKKTLNETSGGIGYVWDVENDGYNEIVTVSWDNTTCCYDTQAYAPVERARGDTIFYSERKLYTDQYVPEPNRRASPGHGNGTYSFTLYGLTPGTVYFSQAVAQNSNGTVCGNKSIFLTKPNPVIVVTDTIYGDTATLDWLNGVGATNTYIERNTIPSWSRGAGTVVYNGTARSCADRSLSPSTTYYYRFWGFTCKQGLSQFSPASLMVNVTTAADFPPSFGALSPVNGSINRPLSFSWSIPISDPNGDRFSFTIQCSDGQNKTRANVTNGTKSLALTGLAYATAYRVWVNATDPLGSGLYTRKWYTFTTQQPPNHPPSTPSTPTGPTILITGKAGRFFTNASDPDGDQVQYRFDWNASGAHQYSAWTGLFDSGQTINKSHMWNAPGTYTVKVQARDQHGLKSNWSNGLNVTVIINNPPSEPEQPTGPTTRLVGQAGTYWVNGTDPDGDQIQYRFDWDAAGAHVYSGWTSLVNSGTKLSKAHTWWASGTYVVKVQSRDEHGAVSVWSNGLTVVVSA